MKQSETLNMFMRHYNGKFPPDEMAISLPFNIQEFCIENDARIADLEAELQRLSTESVSLKERDRVLKQVREGYEDQLAQARAEAAGLRAGMERVENALTLLRHIEKRYREVGKTHYDWDKLHADISAIERAVNSTSPSDALSAIKEAMEALEFFNNRRKLAHSLRAESPQIAAFVEDIGQQMDKYDALSKLRKHFGDA